MKAGLERKRANTFRLSSRKKSPTFAMILNSQNWRTTYEARETHLNIDLLQIYENFSHGGIELLECDGRTSEDIFSSAFIKSIIKKNSNLKVT